MEALRLLELPSSRQDLASEFQEDFFEAVKAEMYQKCIKTVVK